jgi:hypothetical protein
VVRIRNIGAGTWRDDRALLSVQSLGDADILTRPELATDLLPPNATAETRFRIRVGARPRLSIMLRSGAGNDAAILAPVVAMNAISLPRRARSHAPRTGRARCKTTRCAC